MADLIGAFGMLLLLGAFLASVSGRLRVDGAAYQALNAAGAGLLAWYSLQLGIWIFVTLEGFWALAALWNLAKALRRPRPPGAPADHAAR